MSAKRKLTILALLLLLPLQLMANSVSLCCLSTISDDTPAQHDCAQDDTQVVTPPCDRCDGHCAICPCNNTPSFPSSLGMGSTILVSVISEIGAVFPADFGHQVFRPPRP